MRLERPARGQPETLGNVVPGRGEQILLAPCSRLERRHDPPLALEAVCDVLVELGVRIFDLRAVAGMDPLEPHGTEAPQPVEVAAQRSAAWRDEHAALAEDRIARER